jgi:hypothetical protein
MLGFAALPALAQFIGFYYMPESPRWLVEVGRMIEAEDVLRRLREGTSLYLYVFIW